MLDTSKINQLSGLGYSRPMSKSGTGVNRHYALSALYSDVPNMQSLSVRDVNIEFFPNPDIECDNPVKIRISDFIRAA